jgi:hypothetical protein
MDVFQRSYGAEPSGRPDLAEDAIELLDENDDHLVSARLYGWA